MFMDANSVSLSKRAESALVQALIYLSDTTKVPTLVEIRSMKETRNGVEKELKRNCLILAEYGAEKVPQSSIIQLQETEYAVYLATKITREVRIDHNGRDFVLV